MPDRVQAPRSWGALKTTEFPGDPAGTAVIVPIGSMEQHGPHLPVEVDATLVAAIASRTAARMPPERPALVLPALWVSLAEHHMGFRGTVTLDFATLRTVLRCIVGSLSRQGFRRIFLLNGHGGNMAALAPIVDELGMEFDVPLASATYWVAAGAEFKAILEGQPNLMHACEAETSMMMALVPDLVALDRLHGLDIPPDGLGDRNGVHRRIAIEDLSASGVVGTPVAATAEKGARLLDAAAGVLARLLSTDGTWLMPHSVALDGRPD